jgi:hypothetical protein
MVGSMHAPVIGQEIQSEWAGETAYRGSTWPPRRTRRMGYCTYGDGTLYDVVNGDLEPPTVRGPNDDVDGGSISYLGFHIMAQTDDTYMVQLDGHVGRLMEFSPDEYDDVLELVDDLNDLQIRYQEYDYQEDKEGLVDWAGKIMTHDEERAEADPDLYVHIPRR